MSGGDLRELADRMWAELAPSQRESAATLAAAALRARAGDDEAWLVVRDLAHRLAGTLATLGQREAGAEAIALEDLTSGVTDPDEALLDEVAVRAARLLAALERDRGGA